jgi:hypothetical protein
MALPPPAIPHPPPPPVVIPHPPPPPVIPPPPPPLVIPPPPPPVIPPPPQPIPFDIISAQDYNKIFQRASVDFGRDTVW